MSDRDTLMYLHWFWTALFVVLGVIQMTRGRNFLSASTADCFLKISGPDAEHVLQRVEAAVERRQAAEGAKVPLGLWSGWLCFGLAALAATGRIQPAILYAVMCLAQSLGVSAIFLRLRNLQATRVALLAARSTDAVIPSYWFYAAAISALAILSYTTQEHYRIAAIVVSLSALLSVAAAWKLANLPALFSGVDVPAEQLVDDRLRFFRSRAAMVFALAETSAFCGQAIGDLSWAQILSYALSAVVLIAFGVWMIRRQYAKVQLA